jgi:hypothetical protein
MAYNKKNMLENLILLGSGVKFFGNAFIDELLFLFFSVTNVEFKKINFFLVKNLLVLYPAVISLFYIVEILNESSNPLHNLIYFLRVIINITALFLLSASNSIEKLNFKNATISAWLILGLNFLFGLIEIISNLLTETLDIQYIGNAFWQEIWVGVSYNALLIAFSTLILFANYPSYRNKLIIILANVFIAISHHARLSSLFSYFMVFHELKITNGKLLKKIFYLILIPFLMIQFTLSFLGFDTDIIYYISEYMLSLPQNLYHLFSFQISKIDPSRFDQLSSLWTYAKENTLSVLIGQGAGSSNFGLRHYIASDSSGFLRPIGLVVFIYDYGFIWFTFTYYLFFKMVWENFNRNSIPIFKFFPFFIFIISLVTNLNECIILWILLFHYNTIIDQLKK